MSRERARQGSAPSAAPGDPVRHAHALAGVFDAVLSGRPGRQTPRRVVSESWQRSLAAHVDPERRTPPVVYAADELVDLRAAHPLSDCLPVLRSTLASIADEAEHVMLVTDAEGHILWRDGAATLLSHADGVGLFPGTGWSETAIGTNAMGTALAVLAVHPEGLTGEQLAYLVYGDAGNQTTVRGEIHRLRALIGADLLRTRPYRLVPSVDSDFASVHSALRAGRVDAALRACSGALLPRSDAPAIRELRDELVAGLRAAVLAAGDLDLLQAFAGHPLGRNDLEAHDRLVEFLPPSDVRLGSVAFRRSRLQAD